MYQGVRPHRTRASHRARGHERGCEDEECYKVLLLCNKEASSPPASETQIALHNHVPSALSHPERRMGGAFAARGAYHGCC